MIGVYVNIQIQEIVKHATYILRYAKVCWKVKGTS